MSRARGLAALAGVVVTLAGFAPPAAAQGYTLAPKGEGFSVVLPKQPVYTKSEPEAEDGTTYTSHSYILEANPSYFVVRYHDLPAKTEIANPRRFLEAKIAAEGAEMRGGKYERVEWSMLGGVPAVTAVGHKNTNALRILMVLKGRRLFTLTYAGAPGSARSAAAVRFTSSFRLMP